MGDYVIAKYIRLSIEDAKTDSMSIGSQRALLDKHIADLDAIDATVIEFVDNGYTGTNFERPAVQELIEMVREGKVHCIVVKDFSRFGRNSIETGYFIERVFPLYSVRFISVCDYFDAADHEGDTGGLEVAFKFLTHESYSFDLSQKIKAAKQEKMRRGEYVTKNCTFGYKLNDARQLVIDEPAAETVRLIFSLALEGKKPLQIERQLYAERRLPAREYDKLRRGTPESELSCVWSTTAIMSILRNEQYIGTYVAGKTKIVGVGSGKAIKVPKNQWVVIPNHHPAIIEKDVFDTVNHRVNEKHEPRRKRTLTTSQRYGDELNSPLKGKVYCGCCERMMKQSAAKDSKFHCTHTRAAVDAECYHLNIPVSSLCAMLLGTIWERARAYTKVGELHGAKRSDKRAVQQSEYEKRIDGLGEEKRRLYERFVRGQLDAVGYKTESAALDAQVLQLVGASSALSTGQTNTQLKEFRELASSICSEETLTHQMVDLLIEKVQVYPGSRVAVKWKTAVAAFFEDSQQVRAG